MLSKWGIVLERLAIVVKFGGETWDQLESW